MLKVIGAVLAMGALASGAALAEDLPKSADECLKSTIGLAKAAEDKKLPEAKLTQLEELLVKMENHCEAKEFEKAVAVSTEIKTVMAAP